MVSVADIIQHIAQQLHWDTALGMPLILCARKADPLLQMQICITRDLEDAELKYLQRCGSGHTFYFRLKDEEHGHRLAEQLFYIVKGQRNNIHYGRQTLEGPGPLYLFIHIRHIVPDTVRLGLAANGGLTRQPAPALPH